MEFTVGKRKIELKFDFKTMFKINNRLGTVNQDTGQRNADGVGAIFYKILERDESAIIDLIQLAVGNGKKAVTEDEILDAIAAEVEEFGTTEGLFDEIEQDMVASGFFKEKISKYIENLQKTISYLKEREETDEIQVQVLEEMVGKMSDAIS